MNIRIDPAKIKQERLAKPWSQEELAHAAGLNVRTVQRVEAGAAASLETSRALAGALDVGVEQLLSEGGGTRASGTGLAGVLFSLAGIVIGAAFGFFGTLASYLGGDITAYEAGVAAGILGAGTGLCCALLGIAWSRWQSHGDHLFRAVPPATEGR